MDRTGPLEGGRPHGEATQAQGVSRRHIPNPLIRFLLAAILLAAVIVYGIVGYMSIERWSLLDSFYMVIITISTVGCTEVHPLSVVGRIFTTSLIIVGVGTMLFGFGVFAETLADNSFGIFGRQRQMEARLNALRGHFILCGYGRIGTQIVIEFEEHNVPYVIIEHNDEPLDRLHKDSRLYLEGDAASEAILKSAGIARAKGLVSAVDSDEKAVYVTLAARALNPGLYIIARGGQPDSIRRLELAGANRVISPYRMAGHRMAELAVHPALVDVLDSLHRRLRDRARRGAGEPQRKRAGQDAGRGGTPRCFTREAAGDTPSRWLVARQPERRPAARGRRPADRARRRASAARDRRRAEPVSLCR